MRLMAIEPPPLGSVIDYPYLWVRERDSGETEGRKSRPTCLVVSVFNAAGEHVVALLPITSRNPGSVRGALEIPALELRRAGLDERRRGWIITDEFNADVLERSWYYAPGSVLGVFSPAFLSQVLKAFRPTLAARGAGVDRRA
jgi:hypothetical protein